MTKIDNLIRIFIKEINLIKKEIQDNVDKVKRQKTVITGNINTIQFDIHMILKLAVIKKVI